MARRHLDRLQKLFDPEYMQNSAKPLFPTTSGMVQSKQQATQAIRTVIAETGETLTRPGPDGVHVERFGRHALRVSGVQFMARRDVSLFKMQLLGRWGSAAILRYAQDAPLQVLPQVVHEVVSGFSLQQLATEIAQLASKQKSIEQLIEEAILQTGAKKDALEECINCSQCIIKNALCEKPQESIRDIFNS